ncbi:TPA: hypothetical protein ACGN1C_002068, partial [Streptococcus agalactiae]
FRKNKDFFVSKNLVKSRVLSYFDTLFLKSHYFYMYQDKKKAGFCLLSRAFSPLFPFRKNSPSKTRQKCTFFDHDHFF